MSTLHPMEWAFVALCAFTVIYTLWGLHRERHRQKVRAATRARILNYRIRP